MATDIWTIKAALDWTVGYLERKGDENPRLAAQWLLSEACGLSRIELYLHYDQPLSLGEREVLRGYVSRRGRGEPLQYITGEVGFRYITVKVRPGVLIPRPETEVLVSEALALLPPAPRPRAKEDIALESGLAVTDGASSAAPDFVPGAPSDVVPVAAFAAAPTAAPDLASGVPSATASAGKNVSRETFSVANKVSQSNDTSRSATDVSRETSVSAAERTAAATDTAGTNAAATDTAGVDAAIAAEEKPLLVADIGTGTGCIACSIASEHPLTRIVATDIAPQAVALAGENAEVLNLQNRVEVIECDLGEGIDKALLGQFDLVVSNPPYVPTAVLADISREVADFEPTLALDGGNDGLEVFDRLLTWCGIALKPGGALAFELHETCLDEAARRATLAGFTDVHIVRDLADRPRVLTARKLQ